MEKCRVLELIGGSLTDGGAETLVKDYVLTIDKSRFDVAVFVDWVIPKTANSRILFENSQTIYTVYPEYSFFWKGIDKFFRRQMFIRRLRKVIKNFNPDVIHVHLDALSYLSETGTLLDGRKLFYTCHSTVKAMLEDNPSELEGARRLVASNGLRLVALHSDMAKDLDRLFNVDNSVVVKNGIDVSRFRSVKESKGEIRSELGIPVDSFVLGHVGRFSKEKNHDQIVKVFDGLRKRDTSAFLLLVGSGDCREETERRLEELGLLEHTLILSNRTDVPRLLKAMDVFILPSLFEGFPLSLVEAQAAGLKCVVSDLVPSDAFVNGKVSALSLKDPVEKWCDAVLDVGGGDELAFGVEELDIRNAVKRIEKLYLGEI